MAARVCPRCGDTVFLDEAGCRAARTDALIGRLLDRRFALLRRIAVGGMGALYEALQLPIERRVAVKVIRPELLGTDAAAVRERFRREARVVSRLKHPCTVTLFDFGETPEGELFMAMELIEGPTLEEVLRGGPLPAERAIAIAVQVAQSLEEAHRHGIVHRDLKPANVMLADMGDGQERVKVVDFGIARLLDAAAPDRSFTLTGKISGTPHYMSPEVVRGGAADHRSDIYALGLILFAAMTGRPAFDGPAINVVLQHLHDPPPTLSEAAPGVPVPAGLQAVLDRALQKQPADRQQSIAELRRELEAVARRAELDALWAGAAEDSDALFAVLRSHAEDLVERVADEIRANVAAYRRMPRPMLCQRVRFFVDWCAAPAPDEGELVEYLDGRWLHEGASLLRLPDLLSAFSFVFPALRRLVLDLPADEQALVERHLPTLERHFWHLLRVIGARYEELRLDTPSSSRGRASEPDPRSITHPMHRLGVDLGGERLGDVRAGTLAALGAGLLVVDEGRLVVRAADGGLGRLLAVDADALVGRPVEIALGGIGGLDVDLLVRHVREAGRLAPLPLALHTPDGARRHVTVRGARLRAADGRPRGVAFLFEETTSRERLLDALVHAGGPGLAEDLLAAGSALDLRARPATVAVLAVRLIEATSGVPFTERLPADAERWLRAFTAYRSEVVAALTAHHGVLQRGDADELVTMFGAPLAREDAAWVAVQSARAAIAAVGRRARMAPSDEPLADLCAAVATGAAVVGDIGDDRRPTYAAVGEVTRSVRALLDIARPGEVIADTETFERTRALLDFEPATAAGRTAYRVTGERGARADRGGEADADGRRDPH